MRYAAAVPLKMNDGSMLPAGALIPLEVNMRNAKSWVSQGKIIPVPDAPGAVKTAPASGGGSEVPKTGKSASKK